MYYLKPVILFIPLLVIQITLVPMFALDNIIPDLITILVVLIALKRGQIEGMLYGFTFGLFLDIFTGGLIGSAMFSKTLAGFIAGYFRPEVLEEIGVLDYRFVGIVFLCASIDAFFYTLLGTTELSAGIQYFIFDYFIFPGLYTAVVSLPLAGIKPGRIPI